MIILHNEAKIFEDKKTPIIVMSRDRSYFQKITYTQSFFSQVTVLQGKVYHRPRVSIMSKSKVIVNLSLCKSDAVQKLLNAEVTIHAKVYLCAFLKSVSKNFYNFYIYFQ